MEHIAIDLGGRESQVCVRGADGAILQEHRCPTRGLAKYLEGRPASRVIVETCSESFAVADAAAALGHEVRVVPAALVRSLGVGSRRTKTDLRDARILSEVSCRIDLPSVHIPATESRQRKTMCGMREALVGARTKMINTVRGWLRGQGIECRSGVPRFVERVRQAACSRGDDVTMRGQTLASRCHLSGSRGQGVVAKGPPRRRALHSSRGQSLRDARRIRSGKLHGRDARVARPRAGARHRSDRASRCAHGRRRSHLPRARSGVRHRAHAVRDAQEGGPSSPADPRGPRAGRDVLLVPGAPAGWRLEPSAGSSGSRQCRRLTSRVPQCRRRDSNPHFLARRLRGTVTADERFTLELQRRRTG